MYLKYFMYSRTKAHCSNSDRQKFSYFFFITGPNFNHALITILSCSESHLKGENSKILVGFLNPKWVLTHQNVQNTIFEPFFDKQWVIVLPAKFSSGLLSSGILSSGLLS